MDAAAIAFTTIKPIGQWCKPLYVMMLLNYWLWVGFVLGTWRATLQKLSPVVAYHQKLLDKFLKSFWDCKLLAYQNAPSDEAAQKLRSEFWDIFATQSGYEELDERKH